MNNCDAAQMSLVARSQTQFTTSDNVVCVECIFNSHPARSPVVSKIGLKPNKWKSLSLNLSTAAHSAVVIANLVNSDLVSLAIMMVVFCGECSNELFPNANDVAFAVHVDDEQFVVVRVKFVALDVRAGGDEMVDNIIQNAR